MNRLRDGFYKKSLESLGHYQINVDYNNPNNNLWLLWGCSINNVENMYKIGKHVNFELT